MVVLKTDSLKRYYGKGDLLVKALDGVSLEVKMGEFVVVAGSSGSGKSTLLHLLGGLDRATEGDIFINGESLRDYNNEELTVFRRRNLGFVFQDFNLIPVLNVYENIVLPVELDGGEVDGNFVREIIDTLGLGEKLDALPDHLSGGQQQRVAIARALVSKPAILLADEPTGNLDSKKGREVVGLLKSSGRRFGQTIIMITHNEELSQFADRILHLEDGLIRRGN